MTKPFYERLIGYYAETGKVLRGEASAASIFPNKTDIGNSRERIYAEFLRSHIPSSCSVQFGGFLFDQEGNESRQIDIILTNSSSLQFKPEGGKSFACIDGCIAIASIKSCLDKVQLHDALINIASIPNKEPAQASISGVHPTHYSEWPLKLIFSSDGNELETTMQTINEFYQAHPDIPIAKQPNLIHVAGKHFIHRVLPGGEATLDGGHLAENRFYGYSETTDVYALFRAVVEIQSAVAASSLVLNNYSKMIARLAAELTKPDFLKI